jgi:hypothetical protein
MGDLSHEQQAREYLGRVLGPQCFADLAHMGSFHDNPLAGEGPVSVFAFTATREGSPPEPCVVVAGQTEPNYYPAWNLSADEIFNLHIGTRFLLVLQVGQRSLEDLPFDVTQTAESALAGVAPGQPVVNVQPAAAFSLEDQTHVVARCRIGPEEVYLVLGDIPLGIYRRIDLAPHVIYRMHLGQVIRMERTDDDI